MNKFYLLILLTIFHQQTYGQTKLCILGTIHQETTNIKSEDYYKVFQIFNPYIILYEADTILDIRNSLKGLEGSVEFKVIHNYLRSKPKTKIFPYDWTGKQNYRAKNNYWAKIDSMNRILQNYFIKGQADKLSTTTLEAFTDFSSIETKLNNEDLLTINKPSSRILVELKSKWEYKKLVDMANSNDSLKSKVPTLQMGQDYWDIRNKEMAKNILIIVKQYPNKQILVQTGNAHKYYLYNELEPEQKDNNFIIVEYWEKK
jgi:hypothetical protein